MLGVAPWAFQNELPKSPDEKNERKLCRCFKRLSFLVPEQCCELPDEVVLSAIHDSDFQNDAVHAIFQ